MCLICVFLVPPTARQRARSSTRMPQVIVVAILDSLTLRWRVEPQAGGTESRARRRALWSSSDAPCATRQPVAVQRKHPLWQGLGVAPEEAPETCKHYEDNCVDTGDDGGDKSRERLQMFTMRTTLATTTTTNVTAKIGRSTRWQQQQTHSQRNHRFQKRCQSHNLTS